MAYIGGWHTVYIETDGDPNYALGMDNNPALAASEAWWNYREKILPGLPIEDLIGPVKNDSPRAEPSFQVFESDKWLQIASTDGNGQFSLKKSRSKEAVKHLFDQWLETVGQVARKRRDIIDKMMEDDEGR